MTFIYEYKANKVYNAYNLYKLYKTLKVYKMIINLRKLYELCNHFDYTVHIMYNHFDYKVSNRL